MKVVADSHTNPELRQEPEEGGGAISGACIAIPDGEYELAYLYYKTGYYFGRPKVVVYFSIINHNTYAGTPVEKFYNVESIESPPKKYGRYQPPARGRLVREHTRLNGRSERLDRISFAPLKGKRIRARLETVKNDFGRQPLPKDGQYTKVAELLYIIDDDFG